MDLIRQDLRHALRALGRQPGFTAVVLLTLALGIGANAAIFSLLDQVMLRSLPVARPGELVVLDGPGAFVGRTMNAMTFSHPMYVDFRDRNAVFSGAIARFPTEATVTWNGQAERATAELVSGNYFATLGVPAFIGRTLTPDDDRVPGAHPVVVLGHGYWARRFGANPMVLNQTVRVNGQPMTVVGIADPAFRSIEVGAAPDLYVPVMMKAQMTPTWNDLDNRRSRWLNVVARLKPGVTREQAAAAMNVLYRQINTGELKEIREPSARFAKRFVEKKLDVLPGGRGLGGDLRREATTPMLVLMALVGLVLLIACANVANLVVARGAARQRETAVRLALGAGRWRILRERLVESVVLALAGGALGLLVAFWTGRAVINLLPEDGGARVLSADPDLRVLVFTLAVSLVTALVFGLGPALQSTRPDLVRAIKEEAGSSGAGVERSRFRKGLVIAQIALSVLLLAAAGLFARSLYNLRTADPGLRVDELLTFSVDPLLSGYDQARAEALFERVRVEVATLPGVRGVSMSALSVLANNDWQMTVGVDGYHPKDGEDMNPGFNAVGPSYFSTMGIPLVAGREFTERDTKDARHVAIINEKMARYFFGTQNPVGRRMGIGRRDPTDIEIVGVVKDTKSSTLREEIPRFVYLPAAQTPEPFAQLTFYVRSAGTAAASPAAVRDVVRHIDPNLPVFDLRTLRLQVDRLLTVDRMVAVLSMAFGLLATLLAAIGLYGVMSYSVARRTREIGIRMALGAERRGVLQLVLGEVAWLAAIGLAIGVPLAVGVARLVRSQLFGLSPLDPATLAGATAMLVAVAFVAGSLPARRAAAVEPIRALRFE